MILLKFIIKQRHWVIASLTLAIVCLHFVGIRNQINFVEKDQQHRTKLIVFLVENMVKQTFEIFENSLNSSNGITERPDLKGVRYWSSTPFNDQKAHSIAERFGLNVDSLQFIAARNHNRILWSLDYDETDSQLNLIAGRITSQQPTYLEVTIDLSPHFPALHSDSNTILMIEDQQQRFILPNGKLANVSFENDLIQDDVLRREPLLDFEEITKWDLHFFKLNSDQTRFFHVVNIPLPQLKANILVFDNMTSSAVKLSGSVNGFIEVLALLGLGYLLMQTFSHYQHRTTQELESDTLTGLKNRLYLKTASSRFLSDKQEDKYCCTGVIAIDLDHFKRVNDTYGHHVGDSVLVRVSEILLENVRSSDECYRVGGDEFIIILKADSQSDIVRLAERIRAKISTDPRLHNLVEGGISASLGLVDLSTGQSIEEAVIFADEMLYRAKSSGRNFVQSSI